ncbi:hypothetical protein SK128_000556 [Halocaridina rubra]|uniref:Uncharacterized protein n=1 Tax=Halocaridina rubra TaxID=373956 RepID=A0AAN9A438_HALRR
MVWTIAEHFDTELLKKQVEIFQRDFAQEVSAEYIRLALERIDDNIAWMTRNFDDIVNWLKNNGYDKHGSIHETEKS